MFRIHVSDPTLVHDLADFFGRADCVALRAGRGLIEVRVPRARSADHARGEVLDMLAALRATNPGVEAELAD